MRYRSWGSLRIAFMTMASRSASRRGLEPIATDGLRGGSWQITRTISAVVNSFNSYGSVPVSSR